METRLKRTRLQRGLSLREVGRRLLWSHTALHKAEQPGGATRLPLERCVQLSDLYRMPIELLFDESIDRIRSWHR